MISETQIPKYGKNEGSNMLREYKKSVIYP